jgi:DNA-binding transcriptional regulator YhcF (GntR family)
LIKFSVAREGVIPLHEQLKIQIRLELAVGRLRPGDYLPSIRQADEQLQIGTATIRRAYEELAASGVVTMQRGRGVFISDDAANATIDSPLGQFEELFSFLQGDLRQRGLMPAAFARFLTVRMMQAEQERPSVAVVEESQTLADDHAQRLREALQIPLVAFRLDDFNRLSAAKRSSFSCVLGDYSVTPALKMPAASKMPLVLPLDVEFDEIMMQDFAKLPKGTTVPMVIPDDEYAVKGVFLSQLFSRPVQGRAMKVQLLSLGEVSLPKLLKDKRHARVYVGNGVWDHLDETTRAVSKLRRVRFRVTNECVKRIWGRIGLI